MRYIWLGFLFFVVASVSVLGLRGSFSTKPPLEVFPDMDRQPKYKPQAESRFFANGMTDRPLPPNVVARGRHVKAEDSFLAADDHLYRGYRGALLPQNSDWLRGFPPGVEINQTLMDRGRERFTLFCSPCHGQLGDGNGITRQYLMNAANLVGDERIRTMAEGEIFNTITNGKATMYGYGDRIPAADRWAIIAYVRALQRAQNGRVEDVPAANRAELGL
jgi:mono/diheme cytochrome c family protein